VKKPEWKVSEGPVGNVDEGLETRPRTHSGRTMSANHSRKIFVNLPVRDLKKSMDFFATLGFEFNPQFTDDKAACMIISDEAFVMLLSEPFFRTFTKRELCDTTRHTESLFALSCDSRAEVDELVKKAVAAGGRHAMDSQDHGFMYGWSFYDLDGHHWEVLWMDPKSLQQSTGERSS
jgi:predicted lactoylglutathione lyase